MNKNFKLIEYSKFLLNDCKINVDKNHNIVKKLANYIELLIFNIVSISCILCILIENNNKLNEDIIELAKEHINKSCKIRKNIKGGGLSLPLQYYGGEDNNYSSENNTGGDISALNLSAGFARMQIGGGNQIGGCTKCEKIFMIYINQILKDHNIKASKDIKKKLLELIKLHMKNLITVLKNNKKILTNKRLDLLILKICKSNILFT